MKNTRPGTTAALETYHVAQYDTRYRSTERLGALVTRLAPNAAEVCDVACGAGANVHHLRPALPAARFTGIDIAEDLLVLARGRQPNVAWQSGDIFNLGATIEPRKFDLVTCIQTLSWLPSYEQPLRECLRLLRPGGWFVASSLFTDTEVETRLQARDYTRADPGPLHYNVYRQKGVEEVARAAGGTEVVWERFDLDLPLAPPAHRGLGTYTVPTAEGRLLQFSGPIWLPWYFVAVKMG